MVNFQLIENVNNSNMIVQLMDLIVYNDQVVMLLHI